MGDDNPDLDGAVAAIQLILDGYNTPERQYILNSACGPYLLVVGWPAGYVAEDALAAINNLVRDCGTEANQQREALREMQVRTSEITQGQRNMALNRVLETNERLRLMTGTLENFFRMVRENIRR